MATRLNKPCLLLIVIAGMERLAFKGVASNLVTYLTEVVKMSNSSAAKMVNSWCGFTSIVPLLVAPLADSYLDRYFTILASSFFYVLGLLALASTTMEWPWTPLKKIVSSSSSLSWSLYLISLGQGGYNPSLQAFGADQLDDDEDQDELPDTVTKTGENSSSGKKSLFFQCWYFGICSGSLLGVSMMPYIQDTIGWGLGFAIPAIAMITSIVFFSLGSRFYTYKNQQQQQQQQKQEKKSVGHRSFGRIIQVIKATVSRITTGGITLSENKPKVPELELEEVSPLCHCQDLDSDGGINNDDSQNGIALIEISKVVVRLLPVWTTLLMFAVIFQQPATFFTRQGMTMKRNIGPKFKIPPAALQSAITVSIILLMPTYNAFFIPLARFITRNDGGISVRQRMGIGMFLSVIAMVIAAIVERKRRKISKLETEPLSIFWLLPQYILLGISDIFTVVGMQEFFYSEVPARMKTMGIALYTSVFGVGSFLGALLISLIEHFTSSGGGGGGGGGGGRSHGWFSDDMKEARLDKYYWLLALTSAASLITFVMFCTFCKK